MFSYFSLFRGILNANRSSGCQSSDLGIPASSIWNRHRFPQNTAKKGFFCIKEDPTATRFPSGPSLFSANVVTFMKFVVKLSALMFGSDRCVPPE
jgi:hypothetical protein